MGRGLNVEVMGGRGLVHAFIQNQKCLKFQFDTYRNLFFFNFIKKMFYISWQLFIKLILFLMLFWYLSLKKEKKNINQ